MVYLKQYLQFLKEGNDVNHNYNTELDALRGIFDRLGLAINVTTRSSKYLGDEYDHENYTEIKMNWYLKTESVFKKNTGSTSVKPLRIFSDFISDGVTYPMFWNPEFNSTLFNDGISNIEICIGLVGEDKLNRHNPFFNTIDYRDRSKIRGNVLSILLNYWEQTNGNFKSKFDEKIIKAPYVKKLVISYIKYVIEHDKSPNYEELASMIIESLVHSEDAYKIVQEFKERDSYLYLTMLSINPEIDNQLADMGF